MVKVLACAAVALLAWQGLSMAQTSHHHHAAKPACEETALRCADKVTPAFAPDGTLWLAWSAAGHVMVAHSADGGRSFTSPVAVNPEPLNVDSGPDARPKIAIDKQGRVSVAFGFFRDKALNGQVLYTRSTDSGGTFAPLRPITSDPESQRFEALAFDDEGSLFSVWLDKRNRAAARSRNESYDGAALAFAWSHDHGATVSETRIAHDDICECCGLGVAFAAAGRPVITFRNVFAPNVRDHAVITFADPQTPGPLHRVSVDEWRTDVCPHQGPSLAISKQGAYHIAWFTNGLARKGLFYARSSDGGRTFSEPLALGARARAPSTPSLVAASDTVWLAWKEFDGERTTVSVMRSHDDGLSWSTAKIAADTADASDRPLLVANQGRAFLSWQTRAQGHMWMPLE